MADRDRLASAVASLLPYLRRLSRAATGDQALGDSLVADALRRNLANGGPASVETVRRDLFRELCQSLLGVGQKHRSPSVVADDRMVEESLNRLDVTKRVLLLLIKLEGFSIEEAAAVLNLKPEAALELSVQAQDDMSRQERAGILVIEDEPLIALDISAIVEGDGHTVVGIARTRAESVAMATDLEPQLILADIQLADESSGIEAVNDILGRAGDIPVVFITAFPERLLTGTRSEPTYLVTKPFDEETLRLAIAHAQASSKTRQFA